MHTLLPRMYLPTVSPSPVPYWYTEDLRGAPRILDNFPTMLLLDTLATIRIGPPTNGTRYWALQYGMPKDTHHIMCIIQQEVIYSCTRGCTLAKMFAVVLWSLGIPDKIVHMDYRLRLQDTMEWNEQPW